MSWLKKIAAPFVAIAVMATFTASAVADVVPIVGFTPSTGDPVIVLTAGGVLTTGSGADDLVFVISHPGLAALNPPALRFPGTLSLTGFAEDGVATVVGADITQNLTDGRVTISSAFPAPVEMMLTGFVTDAQIVTNSITGSILSGKFDYDGGSLFASFAAAGLSNPGEFSFTLTAITPPPTVEGDGTLSPFDASSTGNFSAESVPVPLPSTALVGLTMLSGLAFVRRGRRVLN